MFRKPIWMNSRESCLQPEPEKSKQLLLANKISLAQYGADGSFGGVTEAGVIAFQKAVGIDADGEVGHDTMSKLLGV